MNNLNRTECNSRTNEVHRIVRSIIGLSKCNTKVDALGKQLTYKNIELTDIQFKLLQTSLQNQHCDIKAYKSLYRTKNLTVRVLFKYTNNQIKYST